MKRAQVEIGRAEDYDIYSIIDKTLFTENKAIEIQKILNKNKNRQFYCFAENEKINDIYCYKIYVKINSITFCIGKFTSSLDRDLFSLKKVLGLSARKGLPKNKSPKNDWDKNGIYRSRKC